MSHYLYRIVNTVSGDQYIGVSKQPFKRWEQHTETNSRVGNNIREFGIECFAFSIIAAFPSRPDADIAEKMWIEKEGPTLNGTHNPEAGPIDLFYNNQQQPAVTPRRQTTSQIDQEKLKDNEHFAILGTEAAVILVYQKKICEQVKISSSVKVDDMIRLAPLKWWQELLGITNHNPPTSMNALRVHTLRVTDSMTRITQQMFQENRQQEGDAGNRGHALKLIKDILMARVRLPDRTEYVSVWEAIRGRMNFVHGFGVRTSSEGLLVADRHQSVRRLLEGTQWENSSLREILQLCHEVKPRSRTTRFGKFTARPICIPENVLNQIGFFTKTNTKEARALPQQPDHQREMEF